MRKNILLFIALLLVTVCVFKTQIEEKKVIISGEMYSDREEYIFTDTFEDESDILVQYFIPQKKMLDNIKIRLAVNCGDDYDTKDWLLRVGLYDGEENLVKETLINTNDFENWKYYTFEINEILDTKQEYKLEIRQLQGDQTGKPWPLSIVCFISPVSPVENVECTFNGKVIDGNIELTYQYEYINYIPCMEVLIFDVFLIFLLCIFLKYNKEKHEKLNKIIRIMLIILTPVFMFVLLEYINGNLNSIIGSDIIKNLIIYYCVYGIFCLIFRKIKTASCTYGIFILIIALVEFYVMKFRGRPFMIFDLLSWQTALTVAGSYSFSIDAKLGICIHV